MSKKTEEKVSAVKSEVVPNTEPVAYIGPTIRGVATHGTVFNNGVPETLKVAAKEKPLLEKLIVKLSDFAKAQKSIICKKGVYYEAYKSI